MFAQSNMFTDTTTPSLSGNLIPTALVVENPPLGPLTAFAIFLAISTSSVAKNTL